MATSAPTMQVEADLLRSVRLLAAMDEVGRGALAGPVSVGVVLVTRQLGPPPAGVRDSKLLSPARRLALVPEVKDWAHSSAVGHASPGEIDRVGIIAALRLAAQRALAALDSIPDLVLLDGSHDWLTDPESVGLLAFTGAGHETPPVKTMVKADLRCASVAAASVLAKVERDALLTELAGLHPQFGWEQNKGYASAQHQQAIAEFGPCEQHRRSWRLPQRIPAPPSEVTL